MYNATLFFTGVKNTAKVDLERFLQKMFEVLVCHEIGLVGNHNLYMFCKLKQEMFVLLRRKTLCTFAIKKVKR